MKAKELRNMADEELKNSLVDQQKRLFDLRFQAATDRLEAPDQIRATRRDIARILTVQTERARAAAPTT